MLVTEVLRNDRFARCRTFALVWRNKSEVLIFASGAENLQGILPRLERRGTRGRSHRSESLRGRSPRPASFFGQNDWVEEIHQNSTITIAVKEPEVEHKVRIRDFENWLASNGKSPAEQALKTDLRALFNVNGDETGATKVTAYLVVGDSIAKSRASLWSRIATNFECRRWLPSVHSAYSICER